MSQSIHFATDFKENSMASRMNSGSSDNLNCIKIDPRTGKKFSFNVDIATATAWQHPQQCTFIHARESFHVSSNGGVFVIVLCITSLLTNEIGRYFNYIQIGSWSHLVSLTTISGSLYHSVWCISRGTGRPPLSRGTNDQSSRHPNMCS